MGPTVHYRWSPPSPKDFVKMNRAKHYNVFSGILIILNRKGPYFCEKTRLFKFLYSGRLRLKRGCYPFFCGNPRQRQLPLYLFVNRQSVEDLYKGGGEAH